MLFARHTTARNGAIAITLLPTPSPLSQSILIVVLNLAGHFIEL